ncbi:MAG: VWA domain-containing protein [Terriglobia bacterium]
MMNSIRDSVLRKPSCLVWGIVVILPLLAAKPALPQDPSSALNPSVAGQNRTGAVHYRTLSSIRVQSSLVVVPVTVMSPSGDFVENLSQTDFQVLDDGVPQRITRFGLVMEPVAAVVVVQANEAVAPLLDQVHPLGSLFSNLLLGASGEAAVITYSDRLQVVQSFSSDASTLAQTLTEITASGSKARLNDALGRAILMLANRAKVDRRAMIILSDGSDRGSATTRSQILRAATAANVAIYGLRFGAIEASLKRNATPAPPQPSAVPPPASTPSAASATDGINLAPLAGLALGVGSAAVHKNLLHWYAGYTGGVSYTNSKKDSLQNQLQRIALEINSQYVLAYVPNTLDKTGFHRIRVKVSQPKLRVRARAGYFYGLPE